MGNDGIGMGVEGPFGLQISTFARMIRVVLRAGTDDGRRFQSSVSACLTCFVRHDRRYVKYCPIDRGSHVSCWDESDMKRDGRQEEKDD